jgi:hypothetical protein
MRDKFYCIVFFPMFFLLSCVNNNNIEETNFAVPNLNSYDSSRFNNIIFIDTANCPQFFYSRPILDSFKNEIATIALRHDNSSDTIISTVHFRSLFVCNLPYLDKRVGDTILISGSVYVIRGDERMPGNPTVLYKIVTKRKL